MSVLLLSRKLTDVIQNGATRQVEKLLRQGANPNQLQPEGISPFHYAVGQQDERNPELTRLMLEYGGDPNIRSSEGMTPLHVAATWGHAECLRLLLLNGGDTEAKDQDGLDCLDLASQYENSECVDLILDFMRETEDDCCKYTMVPYGDRESLAYLMKREEDPKIARHPRRDTAMYTENINSLLSTFLLENERDHNMIFDVTSPSHPYLESRDAQRIRPSVEKHRRSAETRGDETGSSEESFVTCASVDASDQDSSGQGRVSTSPKKSFLSRTFQPMMTSSPPVSICGDDKTPVGHRTWSQRSRLRELCNDSGFDATHTYESCSTTEGVSCNNHSHTGYNLNQNCCCSPRPCCRQETVPQSCRSNHATSCQNACCRHSICQIAHCGHSSCNSNGHHRVSSTCSNTLHSYQTCSNQCSTTSHKSHSKPNDYAQCVGCDIESPRKSRHASSATSLVDKFTTISIQDDRNSDTSSLFSHISVLTPLKDGEKGDECRNSEVKESSDQRGDKSLSKNSQKDIDSPLSSDTDSLADYIPKDFNMSDLTINSNNSNKRTAGGYTIGPVRISPVNRDRLSVESALSTASTIDYVYVDPEEGITLIERHCPSVCSAGSIQTSPDSAHSSRTESLNVSDDATVLYDWQNYGQTTPGNPQTRKESGSSCRTGDSERTLVNTPSAPSIVTLTPHSTPDIPPLLKRLSNQELKSRLQSLGDEPGPVTSSTRQTYLIRLADLENNPNLSRIAITPGKPGFSPELRKALSDQFCYSGLEEWETQMVEAFQKPNPDRKWREGILKSSFNYLLLDPRIAQNLPIRSQSLGDLEVLKVFISSIFYVGKGKRSRPYCHLYEAIKHRNCPGNKKASEKVQKILDIWQEGCGVISLHIFQNVIPVEAYTREACMVDAIGLSVLTNKKRGDYYGVSSTWTASQRRQVGVWLLRKALRIFLAEGERQICPPDIGVGQ